jgi:hypothetical protein
MLMIVIADPQETYTLLISDAPELTEVILRLIYLYDMIKEQQIMSHMYSCWILAAALLIAVLLVCCAEHVHQMLVLHHFLLDARGDVHCVWMRRKYSGHTAFARRHNRNLFRNSRIWRFHSQYRKDSQNCSADVCWGFFQNMNFCHRNWANHVSQQYKVPLSLHGVMRWKLVSPIVKELISETHLTRMNIL